MRVALLGEFECVEHWELFFDVDAAECDNNQLVLHT
jgi:hypothetical protein